MRKVCVLLLASLVFLAGCSSLPLPSRNADSGVAQCGRVAQVIPGRGIAKVRGGAGSIDIDTTTWKLLEVLGVPDRVYSSFTGQSWVYGFRKEDSYDIGIVMSGSSVFAVQYFLPAKYVDRSGREVCTGSSAESVYGLGDPDGVNVWTDSDGRVTKVLLVWSKSGLAIALDSKFSKVVGFIVFKVGP